MHHTRSLVAAATAAAAATSIAVPALPAGADTTSDDHCVLQVIGQEDSGRFITDDPVCYPTLAEALGSVGVDVDAGFGVDDLATSDVVARAAGTLGIHYDGSNRSGSSITVSGADCNGGYVNLSAAWTNRISSTANNCGSVLFWDGYDKTGSFETTGVFSVNLGALNNAANSISYGS